MNTQINELRANNLNRLESLREDVDREQLDQVLFIAQRMAVQDREIRLLTTRIEIFADDLEDLCHMMNRLHGVSGPMKCKPN